MDEHLRKWERARSLGDMSAHAAIKAYRQRKGLPPEIPVELVDWDSPFGRDGAALESRDSYDEQPYANPSADIRPGLDPNFSDLSPFERRDVKRVIACSEGNNDGPSWLALLELWDGRFAYVTAWCDYTGWG